MRYLIVAAHPDDEALGAGALIHKKARTGHKVYACILSHWSPTRDDNLKEGIKESHKILGVEGAYVGDFGCMRFKDEDHHAIVRFIESCMKDCQPDVIITHHPSDVHIDHAITAECCMEAVRLPQRMTVSMNPVKNVLFMEVPSSTGWNINPSTLGFKPTMYFNVMEEDIDAKIRAIGVYKDVIREHPHPRSVESLKALSVIRGSESGLRYAEAFQQVFMIDTDGGVE